VIIFIDIYVLKLQTDFASSAKSLFSCTKQWWDPGFWKGFIRSSALGMKVPCGIQGQRPRWSGDEIFQKLVICCKLYSSGLLWKKAKQYFFI